jgi:multiple sugar transport system permease protein
LFPKPIELAPPWRRAVYVAALVLGLALWLLPLLAIAWTSVRSLEDMNLGNYWGMPERFALLENLAALFTTSSIGQFLINSLAITVASVAAVLVVSTMAAFALAKYRIRGANWLLGLFIAGNLVPPQILMIPVRDLVHGLQLYDTRWGLIFFHVGFQAGFCTFFLRNFIRGIPEEMLDAARIDGATEFQLLLRVVVPLIAPVLAALMVLEFTFIWNDYFWSLVLVQSDSVRPITAGLRTLKGMYLTSSHLLALGSLIAALPPVLLFLALQRQLFAGVLLGGRRR